MKHKRKPLQYVKEHASSTWNSPLGEHVLEDIISCLCNETQTPFGLSVQICLRFQDYDALLSLTVDPLSYESTSQYAADAQIAGLINKYPFWKLNLDPKIEAMKKFIEGEMQCMNTNLNILDGSLNKDPFVAGVLHQAQRIISGILGDVPDVASMQFKFGPGANLSVKNNTTVFDKLSNSLEISPVCKQLADKFLSTCPGLFKPYIDTWPAVSNETGERAYDYLDFSDADRLELVDKNAKTKRTIGITGVLNSVIQRAIGIDIRDKLKPLIDLSTAQEDHKAYARSYSVSRKGATVDIANASGTISYGIVGNLFPADWFSLMNQSRVPQYAIDGIKYTYQQFSSMGNGYTFEMETLLFYALARATTEALGLNVDIISVYGDDIIIPNDAYEALASVLTSCGFTINDSKSFHTGNFRESCGGDYMAGVDVRPFNLKDKISLRTLFLMHNFFVRKSINYVYPKTFRYIRKLIGKPVCALFRGNHYENDGFLLDFNCNHPPSYYIEEKMETRELPDNAPYDVLKTFALYRQMYPEYLKDINITWQMGNKCGMQRLHKAFGPDSPSEGFYLGTTPCLNLTKSVRNPKFTARSLAGREHWYSSFGCWTGAELLEGVATDDLIKVVLEARELKRLEKEAKRLAREQTARNEYLNWL